MTKYSVMVVDDSAISLRNLSNILEELDFNVAGACFDGQQACDNYSDLKPDLVTMDITMPVMDGIEATKKIVESHPEAVIIMVTSHAQKQTVIDAVRVGARGYIIKPFNKEKVAESITKVIDKYLKKE
ncbi:MAG: response regulator [Thermodesulfobacteriota bacterium]